MNNETIKRIFNKSSPSNSKIDKSKFSKDEWEVVEWGKRCKKEMEDMKSRYITWPRDLSLKNIGERNNGEIVFFDI